MDKVFASPEAATEDIGDGATIAVSGFGISGGPSSLLSALAGRGSRELTLVGNAVPPAGNALIEAGQVRHLIMSFTARPGGTSPAEEQIARGELTFEMVPQGTLVERLRAGGAGIGAIYTPTGLNSRIAEGKELRYFNGRPHLLETAIRPDFAFVVGYRADHHGNVEFRGGNRHFGPSFAKSARVAIVEVEQVVEVGEIPPERIDLPGIFVSRVVQSTAPPPPRFAGRRRSSEEPRVYNGKPAWSRLKMAEVAASLLPDGSYVNLGLGIPSFISSYIKGRDILLHGENGILGYGDLVDDPDRYPDVFNASGAPVTPNPGVSYFDSVEAFEMVRSGRVHVVALGAYQVDREGSVANWATGDMQGGGIGGAMDMVSGGATVMVLMEHRDSHDRAKLLDRCTYPLTGKACVDIVVTDLAVLRRTNGTLSVDQVAPGFSAEEILSLTEFRR